MNSQTAVAQAVSALVMAGAGNVPAKAPKSKAGRIVEVKRSDMSLAQVDAADDKALDGILSTSQWEALETMAALAEDIRYTVESKRAAMVDLAAIVYPTAKSLSWERYSPITRMLRARFGQYPYREFRRAVLALIERNGKGWKVPTASGNGKRKVARGISPKVWYRGIASSMDTLLERFERAPKDDLDVDAMRAFTRAVRDLEAASARLAKRITA